MSLGISESTIRLKSWTVTACLSMVASLSLVCIIPSFGAADREEHARGKSNSDFSLAEARQYMVELINKDRAREGLQSVELDDLACTAGQLHADEMSQMGYLSHWDTKGRKPDQRYTETGGKDFVMENCHLEFSGYPEDDNQPGKTIIYSVSDNPRFTKKMLEHIQSGFINEKPPHDGHRKNILNPHHNKVGVGLSIATHGESERVACTQEFLNSYLKLDDIPKTLKLGESLTVAGQMPSDLALHGIDVYWEDAPAPMTIKQLEETHSYGPPQTRFLSCFPRSSSASPAISVEKDAAGDKFSLTIDTSGEGWKPGLHYVYVWGRRGDGATRELILCSSRTVLVK